MKRLALLLGLVLLAALGTSAVVEAQQGIRVIGEGTATVPADTAIISVGVQSTNANANQAAAENADRLNKTIDALIKSGVQKDEIMPGQSSGFISSQVEMSLGKAIDIEDYGFPDIRMNEPLGPESLGTISVTSYVSVIYAIA